MPEAELYPPPITLQADAPLPMSLSLRIAHHVDLPEDAESPGNATFPPSVEFAPLQQLAFRISATFNDVPVTAIDLGHSAFLSRLVLFLRCVRNRSSCSQILPVN